MEKRIIPLPNGKPKLLTKIISIVLASVGIPGIIPSTIKPTEINPRKRDITIPLKVTSLNFLK